MKRSPLFIFLVSLLLASLACDASSLIASPAPAETATPEDVTPTVKPTVFAFPTFAPEATFTPSPVPAPTSPPTPTATLTVTPIPAAKTLATPGSPLCEAALTKTGTGKGLPPALTLLRSADAKQWAYYDLTSILQAVTAAEVKTLVCINETTLRDGSYSEKSPAYQLVWDVKLLKWPEGTVVGGRKFTGGPPPAVKTGDGARYGNPPKQEFNTWLNDQLSDGTIFQHSAELTGLALSPDGKLLASLGTDRVIKIWKIPSTAPLPINNGKTDLVSSVAFSPDGKWIGGGSLQGFVYVWNASTFNKTLKSSTQHTGAVNQVTFSPDNKKLASAGADQRVRLWEVSSGKQLLSLGQGNEVNAVAFAPDGKTLASGSKDGNLKFWDSTSGQEVMPPLNQGAAITSLTYSINGTLLIVADATGSIKLWTLTERKANLSWAAHSSGVTMVTASADGNRLASGGADALVKVWELASGKEQQTFRGSRSAIVGLTFATDNKTIAAGSLDGTLKLWTSNP